MDRRTLPTAVGAALTTFVLAVAVSLVGLPALLGVGGGVEGGIVSGVFGLLGITAGVALGSVVGWRVAANFGEYPDRTKRIVSGYAAFGIAFSLAYLALFFAPESVQQLVTIEIIVGAGLVVAAVAHGVEYARVAT